MLHNAINRTSEAAPRRERRTGGRPLPRGNAAGGFPDSVYMVKVETRSPDTGNPVILASSLAVRECYRHRETARNTMSELARRDAAYEIARAGRHPSPAILNAIPPACGNGDSVQVVTMEGFVRRYFVESVPLV